LFLQSPEHAPVASVAWNLVAILATSRVFAWEINAWVGTELEILALASFDKDVYSLATLVLLFAPNPSFFS